MLALVILVSAGLRLWQLNRAALWEDDYFNLDRGLMPLQEMFHAQKYLAPTRTFHDYQPPLFYALQHLALDISQTSTAARLVSFLAGMLALLGFHRAGNSLFGGRAGLYALLLCGLSLFHIDASRAIKTYSVYLCASVWALYFLNEILARDRRRLWLAYAPCAAGMVWSSFLGVPGLMGQLAFAAGVLGLSAWRKEPDWKGRWAWFMAGCLGVFLLCLPWAEAIVIIRETFYSPGMDPLASLSWGKARELVEGFLGHVFVTPPWLWAGLPLLALAGAGKALACGRKQPLILLLLWTGVPLLAVLTSKTDMNSVLSTRHIYNMFGLLILLGGYGAAGLSGLLTGRGIRRDDGLAPLAAGMVLCVAVSLYGLCKLSQYYPRSISYDRDVAYWLYSLAGRADALDVQGWKRATKQFAMGWYLPGMLESAGDMPGPQYRRIFTLSNSLDKGTPAPARGALWASGFSYGPFGTGLSVEGVVNRSPIVVAPGPDGRFVYEDGYAGGDVLRDACVLRNASTDERLGVLLPSVWSEPGSVLYRFVAPEGVRPETLAATLRAVLYSRHPSSPSQAAVEVRAGRTPDTMALAGRITLKDFREAVPAGCESLEEIPLYGSCRKMEKHLDLTEALGGAKEFYVRLDLIPGKEEGYLFTDSFRLDVRASTHGYEPGSALRMKLANLLGNNRARTWKSGAAALDGLFAFAASENVTAPGLPLGSPADLAAFRAEHPGLEPVHVLRDEAGKDVAYFYDPPLRLSQASPTAVIEGEKGFGLRGLVLRGRMEAPSLKIGDAQVNIPVSAPGGSVLMLDPGGEGRLIWSPDFSREGFAGLGVSASENLRPSPDADNDGGLTCREERPCSFTARFVSALPVREVFLEWYPRVVADPAGKNVVRLSYSTDEGKSFTPLEEFKGEGTGKWSGMFAKHARHLSFDKPVMHFTLLAELSGEAAQLWSHARPVDRMWLEARLDARSLPVLSVPGGSFGVSLVSPPGNDVTLRLSDKPVPLFDRLKDWR